MARRAGVPGSITDRVTKLEEVVAGLQARVDALEGSPAPEPPPEPPPPPAAIPARRIADLVELFGVCTFSSMDEHNAWGSWPADYRPASVVAALRYIAGDSGFRFRIREYHYEGRESFQVPWLTAIQQALPETRVCLGVGANGQVSAVPSLLAMAQHRGLGIEWMQGLNEPNTDFGEGQQPFERTYAIQQALWSGRAGARVLGPPIVAGMPNPEGWIRGYCGDGLDALNHLMEGATGHYYPPHCPDLADDTSVRAYLEGLQRAYQQEVWLTEFHPSLFNMEGQRPAHPGWSGTRDAYYTLITLLRCGELQVPLWWFALFDYGSSYICGLFPKEGGVDARPVAHALRTLCQVTGDHGDRRGFEPGKLAYWVESDALVSHGLYQASDGRFFLFLWRSEPEWGGGSVTVDVRFAHALGEVTEYDLLGGAALPVNQVKGVRAAPVNLNASARVLVIQ